jgi:hypothetical protein
MESYRMSMKIVIIDSLTTIEARVNVAIADHLNSKLPIIAKKIESEVRTLVRRNLGDSHEFQSIISGILRHEFGFPAGQETISADGIANLVANNIYVSHTKLIGNARGISGGLTIYGVLSDYSNLLNSSFAEILTDKGERLKWLEWLLLEGNRVIIQDYKFQGGKYPQSRSGNGIMISGTNRFWKVPAQFSGTASDNWITRVLEDSLSEMQKITKNIVRKNI